MKYLNAKTGLIAILAVVVLILIFANPITTGKVTYDIQDRCGQFVNLFSHTIEDEQQCTSQCRAKCESNDKKIHQAEFIEKQNSCNECTCTCKD